LGTPKVLLVDDESAVRNALRKIFDDLQSVLDAVRLTLLRGGRPGGPTAELA